MGVFFALGRSGDSNFALVKKIIKKKMPSVSTNQQCHATSCIERARATKGNVAKVGILYLCSDSTLFLQMFGDPSFSFNITFFINYLRFVKM